MSASSYRRTNSRQAATRHERQKRAMLIVAIVAFAISMFIANAKAEDAPLPAVIVTRVNIETLKQMGAVGITPSSVNHFQVIVKPGRVGIVAVKLTFCWSVDGEPFRYMETQTQEANEVGAVFTFPVREIAKAVPMSAKVVELVEAASTTPILEVR
jgi:hypothetical protein